MKENYLNTTYSQAFQLIDAGRYKDTFTLLRRRLGETPVAGCLGRLNQAESTYKYLLQFFAQGSQDPGRKDILADLKGQLLDVAQLIDRETASTDSPAQYYSTLRMLRLRPADPLALLESLVEKDSMAELALAADGYPMDLLKEIEDAGNKLFELFWTSDSIPSQIFKDFSDNIVKGVLPYRISSLVIAGVGLGLMSYFDRDAIMLLCDASKSEDYRISARALVTLVLALDRWKDRIAGDRKLLQRIESLVEVDGMKKKIRTVVFALIKTRDTDRVSRKMQKEVIPGLMQFGPDIIKRLKKASEETSLADMEGNPEWEELLKNSGLEEKIRELTEMQSDGADVMMSAFSNLKGYPFFRQLSNWMLPFSTHHTMLNSLSTIGEDDISMLLELNGMMCDSDKYSFAFSLANMPGLQRKMVMGQMQGQMEQLREQMKEFQMLKAGREFEDEVIRYCRDLYRFNKLYPKKSEFYDPFVRFVDFSAIPVVSGLFDDNEDIAALAEFYFKRGYHTEALEVLGKLAEKAGDTPHIWEKIGFCIEKVSDDDNEAVEAYMKAQLFNPDSKWISRRLGLCYRRMGDYRNAVEYLRMSLPDDGSFDRRISLMISDTLIDGGNWDEALKELYRVDYETPGDPDVVRRMARCAFRSIDFDKTLNWLDSISSIDQSEEDYRMRGHISFLRGDFQDAMRWYRMTVRQNDKRRLWKTTILGEMPVLESMGGARSDMLLLLESLSYSLES